MSEEALQACVNRHLEHAALVFMLDDELGTHHGLSWADFVLLTVLDAAGGAAPATELARTAIGLPNELATTAGSGPDHPCVERPPGPAGALMSRFRTSQHVTNHRAVPSTGGM